MSIAIGRLFRFALAAFALSAALVACTDTDAKKQVVPAEWDGVRQLESAEEAHRLVDISTAVLASADAVILADDPMASVAQARELQVPVLPNDEAGRAEASRLGAEILTDFDSAMPARVVARPDRALAVATTELDAAETHLMELAGLDVVTSAGDPRADPTVIEAIHTHDHVLAIDLDPYLLQVIHTDARVAGDRYLLLSGQHFVALYGHPSGPALGLLGEQGPKKSVERVQRLVRRYEKVAPDVTFQPAFEIIATVATAEAGPRRDYSARTAIKDLIPLIDAAEKAGVTVILDLQPGRANMLEQAKHYEELLKRPHVGLALDPEWKLGRRGKPLRRIGHVNAKQVNEVSDWLATLTREHVLPQKLFVLHQFQTQMIRDRPDLRLDHPELATVIHVDGQGPQAAKQATWNTIRKGAPDSVFWGWKNFVDEDEPMLTPKRTWRQVRPHPHLITYQ